MQLLFFWTCYACRDLSTDEAKGIQSRASVKTHYPISASLRRSSISGSILIEVCNKQRSFPFEFQTRRFYLRPSFSDNTDFPATLFTLTFCRFITCSLGNIFDDAGGICRDNAQKLMAPVLMSGNNRGLQMVVATATIVSGVVGHQSVPPPPFSALLFNYLWAHVCHRPLKLPERIAFFNHDCL